MKILPIIILLIFAGTSPAFSQNADYAVLQQFASNVRAKNYPPAEEATSLRSHELFQKYSAYNIGNLTPADFRLIKQYANSNFRYLYVGTANNKATTVAFTTENGEPKIDLPETFRLGFGEQWQQRLGIIEQSYLFARQQFGDQQSMALLSTMLKKN